MALGCNTSASETQCESAASTMTRGKKLVPRQDSEGENVVVSPARWKVMVAIFWFWCWCSGYDVSNVANIQPQIYNHFHDIRLLPWIALSYSTAAFASLVPARRLSNIVDIRWMVLVGQVIFIVGAAISGAASSMAMLIVGRIITGMGGSLLYVCTYTYISTVATPAQGTQVISGIGISWSLGVIVGGPIGTGFAQNHHTTWRWALYLVAILMGISLVVSALIMPRSVEPSTEARPWEQFLRMDPLGILLYAATVVLFAIAVTFSGTVWRWSSGAAIATWVVFAVVFVTLVLQQALCILTAPEDHALPVAMISERRMLPLWIATGSASAVYGVTTYYTPLFFAFMRGMGPIQQAVRLFPFIFVTIASIAITGRMLTVLRYKIVYITAGVICLAAGAALATTLSPSVSDSQVMGLTALIGVGLGMSFVHGSSVANATHTDSKERVIGALLGNLSLFSGVSVSLMIAGCIYQNIGYHRLSHVLQGHNLARSKIQKALAGVASFHDISDPELGQRILEAMCSTLGRLLYIVVAAGAVCLICGLVMEDEKLMAQVPQAPEHKESEGGVESKST